MNLIAFALLDIKTGHFNTPFFMTHHGSAIRAVMDLGGDLSTTVGRHPADFVLCEVGLFNDQTGHMLTEQVRQLGTVLSFLPHGNSQRSIFEQAPAVTAEEGA